MTIFDLVFLLTFLGSVITLAVIVVRALRRRPVRPIWRRLLLAWLAYAVVLLAVSLLSPQRVVAAGTPQCSDDWCITVVDVVPIDGRTTSEYLAHLDLSNRGRGRAQRERFVAVQLVTADGSRTASVAEPRDVPFDTLIAAGQTIHATRRFRFPLDTRPTGLVVARVGGGRFPGCCIIGDDNSFLHKPTIIGIAPRS